MLLQIVGQDLRRRDQSPAGVNRDDFPVHAVEVVELAPGPLASFLRCAVVDPPLRGVLINPPGGIGMP